MSNRVLRIVHPGDLQPDTVCDDAENLDWSGSWLWFDSGDTKFIYPAWQIYEVRYGPDE